ncbi:MAG: ribosomal L7Ae/L30e/S12e/Gadd45 family protein [Candidatus Cloacimonetes bacterium]|nr:ribosomal L7Ae/L30e/S12e/Gadd45 family protein [Candidatus Cloacimonadota bacterium]
MVEKIKKEEQEIKQQKAMNLLHLAMKAGKLQQGFDACERSCNRNFSSLLIMAEDVSERTKKRIIELGKKTNTKTVEFGSLDFFGNAFNKRNIGIISVDDPNFTKGILKWIK